MESKSKMPPDKRQQMIAKHALKEVRAGPSKVPSHWRKVEITPETTQGLDLQELQRNMQLMEKLGRANFIENLQQENPLEQIRLHETLERTIAAQKMQSRPTTSSLPLTQLMRRNGIKV